MRGAAFDSPQASGDSVPRAGKRAVADVQLDHVFASRLQTLGNGENVEGGFGYQTTCESAKGDIHDKGTRRQGTGGQDAILLSPGHPVSCRLVSYCLAAMVWASGRTTAGMICESTSSWQIRRWLRYDSVKSLKGWRPQYWRTVK